MALMMCGGGRNGLSFDGTSEWPPVTGGLEFCMRACGHSKPHEENDCWLYGCESGKDKNDACICTEVENGWN